MFWLPLSFGLIAFIYAAAGFGGGSTYIALLILSGVSISAVPVIALSCNVLVAGQGSIQHIRSRRVNWGLVTPMLVSSIPSAFVGGRWPVSDEAFLGILSACLALSGILLLRYPGPKTGDTLGEDSAILPRPPLARLLLTGGVLGLLSGLSGIGGGIFLAPALHLLRLGRGTQISATTSLFITFNSLAGLAGHLGKGLDRLVGVPLWLYISCGAMVIIGGSAGSRFLLCKLEPHRLRQLTAILILAVALHLSYRLLFL